MRVNFLKSEFDIIGRRAGYRCSFPDCGRLTVGPGINENHSEVTGKAAHIYSASEFGPRGQGSLTEAELRSVPNGIWMCGEHADLIDKNKGVRYPVQTLQSWKALHESRIAFQHSGRLATFGFVRSITFRTSALFASGAQIELAKATLIIGANGSGKTAICEWLYSLAAPSRLLRWDKKSALPSLDFEIDFVAPVKHTLRVRVPNEIPNLELDERQVAANPLPIAVTYLEKTSGSFADDLELVCACLDIDPGQAHTLVAMIDPRSIFLSAAEWRREQDDEGVCGSRLYVTLKESTQGRTFASLSGSERSRALLDLAIARARSTAAFVPTLLLLEVKGFGLDWEKLRPYLDLFSQSRTPFQTVVTSWELTAEMEELGWQVYRIVDGPQPRRIEANIRKT